ncbi:HoxN/HupN/NixA family nickel/cobalt transporter [Solicola sp. PLA-1-18]|uniref:HoxN/HupN/NixA family nickel/cobalt transporter n=1 Tax=Solicola sp. PLA-1-18 TaxID=3380532 RepID=UPI003B81E1A1
MASTWTRATSLPGRRVGLAMALVVGGLHLLGGGLLLVAASRHVDLGGGEVFGVGIGVTAYLLGVRHAFDADHVAAIDNTTRRLVGDGGRPLSVGFWFSLGHSTVVFVLCALLALGVRWLAPQVQDGGSGLQRTLGVVGAGVACSFLLLVGLANAVALVRLAGLARRSADHGIDQAAVERQLHRRGPMSAALRPVTALVRQPRHLYPVGLLFGLGFDTATEVSLLVLAGGVALALPWYAIMALPLLFAAGMSLFDTLDGVVMRHAYGWAYQDPHRRLVYNLAVTGISVALAAGIGLVVLAGLVESVAAPRSGPIAWAAGLDLELVGVVVAVGFTVVWLVALATRSASFTEGSPHAVRGTGERG